MLSVLYQQKKNYQQLKIDDYKVELPKLDFITPNFQTFIGIDPGTVNIGVAVISPIAPLSAFLHQVTVTRKDKAEDRILDIDRILDLCLPPYTVRGMCVIEGASFGDTYRQVELAEMRAASVLWANGINITPRIIAPTSIRKTVFGNAKTRGDDLWSNVPKDAATALVCALCAMRIYQLENKQPDHNE